MHRPTVSVVITTHERPKLAKRALQSVVEQSRRPDEILVIEDAGTSDLGSYVASLGNENIRYLRHETNRGLAAARNTGLSEATGDLIAYIDDDDTWLPERLAAQLQRLEGIDRGERARLACIQVGCRIQDPEGRQTGLSMPTNEGSLREAIMRDGAATPSSSFLFVRSALLEVGGFDDSLISGIDHDIWMKLAVEGYSNAIVPEALVVVTADERQTMMSDTRRRIAGIDQYVAKWTPTYAEWFGERAGDLYGRRYFIRVIGGLAGLKLAHRRAGDGLKALKATFRRAGRHPALWVFAAHRILRTYLSYALPQLRVAKHQFGHRNRSGISKSTTEPTNRTSEAGTRD